jgi:hypothetical protein
MLVPFYLNTVKLKKVWLFNKLEVHFFVDEGSTYISYLDKVDATNLWYKVLLSFYLNTVAKKSWTLNQIVLLMPTA